MLAGIVEEKRYAESEVIFKERDPSDSMFLVVEGKVRMHKDGREVMTMGPPQAFGTWALFDEEPRVLGAVAQTEVLVLRIDKEAFIDLLADNVLITKGVLKALTVRLKRLLTRLGGDGGPMSKS